MATTGLGYPLLGRNPLGIRTRRDDPTACLSDPLSVPNPIRKKKFSLPIH